MVKRVVLVAIVLVAVVVASLGFVYWSNLEYSNKTKHETDRWAVITDSKNDVISVETLDSDVWNTLKGLHDSQTVIWVGGIVETWDNYWGFRFNPDTIVVAEITIEGAQSTIRAVSEDLDYWMNTWQKQVYVLATVTEIHE